MGFQVLSQYLFHCLRPYRQNLYHTTYIPKARHELRINSGLAFLFLRSFLGSEGKEEKYSLGRSSIRIQLKRNPQQCDMNSTTLCDCSNAKQNISVYVLKRTFFNKLTTFLKYFYGSMQLLKNNEKTIAGHALPKGRLA